MVESLPGHVYQHPGSQVLLLGESSSWILQSVPDSGALGMFSLENMQVLLAGGSKSCGFWVGEWSLLQGWDEKEARGQRVRLS